MEFVNPYMLWNLILPFVLFVFLITTKREPLLHIFDEKVLARLSLADKGISSILRSTVMLVAMLFIVLALARPVEEKDDIVVHLDGLSLLAALDISGSMRSKDIYPNRLEFAKKKMNMLFDAMPNDEIGVLAFAHTPFMLAPFSFDKETLKLMIEGVDDSYINRGSTNFLALGRLASLLLKERDTKIMVLFTDGGDEEAIAGLSEILEENNIDLFVVLVGTKEGSPVIGTNQKSVIRDDGTVAVSKRNDVLGLLAKDLGGDYVIANTGREDIEELVTTIKSKYKNKEQGEIKIKQRVEYYYYPLGIALILLLIGVSSFPRRRKS